MASSRKPPSAERRRIAVGLSGGIDSVVLLHQLHSLHPVSAIHVHHGLSANAGAWAAFCAAYCRRLGVPLVVAKVKVRKSGKGLEDAAREARYAAFSTHGADVIALAHNLDDQAETVLMNLLRGSGARGAGGMGEHGRRGALTLWRPLLGVPRSEIQAYARRHRLEWVDDESNSDEALTRNFIRTRVGPLLESRFPKWKQALARAAKHISAREAGRQELLREFLFSRGLKAPSEAKLVEMLRQLTGSGARTLIEHDGAQVRAYRGKVTVEKKRALPKFRARAWTGEGSVALRALGGELRFRRAKGRGFDPKSLSGNRFVIRLRRGGERLQPHPQRPRRTLKNLFQEAGVPPWQRDRLPMLFYGDDLVWVPGLGVDARFQAPRGTRGVLPEWHAS